MSDSRNMRTLEVLTITSILAWKVISPNEAPATQLSTPQSKEVQSSAANRAGKRTTPRPEFKLSDEQANQAVAELRSRRLLFPIAGFDPERREKLL